jgi:two-component system LytT family response regulator
MNTIPVVNPLSYPIIRTLDRVKEKLCISTHEGFEMIKKHEITFLEAASNYCVIHYSNKKVVCSKTLAEVTSRISLANFFRVHRSYVINLDHIQSINKGLLSITMENGSEIPISRTNRKAIKEKIALLYD